MTKEIAKTDSAEIMEQVIIKGDLSKLSPQERTTYYMKVCESVGLNPLTRPFEYILLNNKLQLYALKACTEQLRGIHDVSVTDLTETIHQDVFIVTAKVKNGNGRLDAAKGAVPLAGLKGEALANAMMKAETKAKRRATLSLCGLGWLDESEIESIPGAKVIPNAGDANETAVTAATDEAPDPSKHHRAPAPQPAKPTIGIATSAPVSALKNLDPPSDTTDDMTIARQVFTLVKSTAAKATDVADINDCLKHNGASLKVLERASPVNYETLKGLVAEARTRLAPKNDPAMNDDLPNFEDIGR
jgi:hypothetical protein